jgi:hypothetical protein
MQPPPDISGLGSVMIREAMRRRESSAEFKRSHDAPETLGPAKGTSINVCVCVCVCVCSN